jgi:catechol 2,3-dioxygenase-like lactoylglutathione lyase family enzyme
MKQYIAAISLVVRDYDEAIAWYRDKLRFTLVEDVDMGGGKRWVTIAPPGSSETRLLFGKATTREQAATIGQQAGGRVFLILFTDDFARDHKFMLSAGVQFREEPRREAYGTVAVFADLYGNLYDLLEPKLAS